MISAKAQPASTSKQSRQAVSQPLPSRVVPRPVPEKQAKDARSFQIEQLRRRFSPRESSLAGGSTVLVFDLKPSDPDFAFDLDHLACEITVPQGYSEEAPALRVLNKDIPRGFSINIERGWDRLVQQKRGATLLALTTALDRELEGFLSEQRVETVKLVKFGGPTRETGAKPALLPGSAEQQAPKTAVYAPEESFSKDDIAAAKARRALETRQLESRMGKLALYHRSLDGVVYTLPLEPKRRQDLPDGLRSVASVQLIVPLLYPLQALRVLLNDVESSEAERVEELFTEKAVAQRSMSLTSHVNYLAQNLHTLARQAQKEVERQRIEEAEAVLAPTPHAVAERTAAQLSSLHLGKGNVQVIQRPPEWSRQEQDGNSAEDSEESEDDFDSEDGGAVLDHPLAADKTVTAKVAVEKGTAISFPSIELYGVELLELAALSLSVKCLRCKMPNDMTGLKGGSAEKSERCQKCGTTLSATFRPEPIHQNSTRAGFIEVSGCTIMDLLPSTFTPTCSRCSTPTQPLVSVRGETVTNVCRECHARFTFTMPEVRFQSYTPGKASAPLPPAPGPRRRQERLGLHAGEPLPDRGTCAHYRRSYRWFRFGCCSRVYACDQCHDAAEQGHANEWASRMICGFCSREQRYSPEACGFCGRSVVGRKGHGFWEGGRGTRDPVLMRRGDRRKFRRAGGAGAGAGAAAAEAARRKGVA